MDINIFDPNSWIMNDGIIVSDNMKIEAIVISYANNNLQYNFNESVILYFNGDNFEQQIKVLLTEQENVDLRMNISMYCLENREIDCNNVRGNLSFARLIYPNDCILFQTYDNVPFEFLQIYYLLYNKFSAKMASYTNSSIQMDSTDKINANPKIEYIVPVGTIKIKKKQFKNRNDLKVVNIPESVNSIDEQAFKNCKNLEMVLLSNSVREIGWNAFTKCTALKKIYIPSSVLKIEKNAFEGCKNLVIYCYKSSFAESYANDNNYTMFYID